MLKTIILFTVISCVTAGPKDEPGWWNADWQFRTTVTRPTPYRDDAERPVEVVVDFQRLLERAGISGAWDPASVRVVERGTGAEVPVACRTEFVLGGARGSYGYTFVIYRISIRYFVFGIIVPAT